MSKVLVLYYSSYGHIEKMGGTYFLSAKDTFFLHLGLTDSTIHFANATYDYTRNRISDSAVSVVHFTKILDAAAFADSLSNGNHSYSFYIPGSLSVPAGGKVVTYVHFKSGHVYPFGTLSTAANVWDEQTFELNGAIFWPTQRLKDFNTGLIKKCRSLSFSKLF